MGLRVPPKHDLGRIHSGIEGREIWLNGKLNIGIDVQETPPGEGGWGGAAGEGPSEPPASGGRGSGVLMRRLTCTANVQGSNSISG